MMKTFNKLLSILLSLCAVVACFAGCSEEQQPAMKIVDYVAETKLDLDSNTKKQEVTVKIYIDGDTTHFNVPTEIRDTGILKARYMGVNTPESTGQIEEWGKKASKFTKEKLLGAESIIIESDNDQWNVDSTGDRHLVWVWYKPKGEKDYRLLNLELVQNGLSISSGTVADRYGQAMMDAFQQAKAQKLHVHSDEQDPEFYYGEAYKLDIKFLRTNIEHFDGAKVAFEGVVTYNSDNTVYVEDYDAETDTCYAVPIYYGFVSGEIINILKEGNRIRCIGKVSHHEDFGWQVSDIKYREIAPDDPENTIKLSENNAPTYAEITPAHLYGTTDIERLVSLDGDEVETVTVDYSEVILNTSVSMKNLQVIDVYTTQNGGDSDGAMTLTCNVDGVNVDVRTITLYKEDGQLYTAEDYYGKTIDVKGVVDCFSGSPQIKVFKADDITVH